MIAGEQRVPWCYPEYCGSEGKLGRSNSVPTVRQVVLCSFLDERNFGLKMT